MMRQKWIMAALSVVSVVVMGLTASASVTDPNIITDVIRLNSTEAVPVLINGGLAEGAKIFVDRDTFFYGSVGAFAGLDFIQTAMNDKTDGDVVYQVVIDKPGTLFLFVDNRVGDNDASNPPVLGSGVMDWAISMGFTPSPFAINFSEPATAYALTVSGDPNVIELGAQNDGSSRAMYTIAAAPEGWNFPPVISGLPATAKVAPEETLELTATVSDDGVPGTGISVQWSVASAPAGATVTFAPNAASETVKVGFSQEGDYTLTFTADDGEKTSEQTVQVTVAIPIYALQGVQHVTACNDSKNGPTSHVTSSLGDVRNISAPRRRITFYKYDISELKQSGKVFANSHIRLRTKSRSSSSHNMYVYGVKDGLDDLNLDSERWSTLPGLQRDPLPPLSAEITIDTLVKDELSPLLMTFQVPVNDTWMSTPNSAALDAFLSADTNGVVVLMYVAYDPEVGFEVYSRTDSRIDPETDKKGCVLVTEVRKPTWATLPIPQNNVTVGVDLSQLSWTNPEPNEVGGEISCNVYLGTGEPNLLRSDYGYTTLALGTPDSSVAIPQGLLQRDNVYNWIVDVVDSSDGLTMGYVWTFNTNNKAPTVTTGGTQYIWLNNAGDPATATVTLSAEVKDDGLPNGSVSVMWEQIEGPAVTVAPNDQLTFDLVLPEAGDYLFQVTANDGDLTASNLVGVIVRADPCQAAQAGPEYQALAGDFNGDCYVNIADFATFAQNWLECNSLAACQ